MLIGQFRGLPPVLHPRNKTDLEKEGFDHVNEGIGFFL
jgi:hypothetical protein